MPTGNPSSSDDSGVASDYRSPNPVLTGAAQALPGGEVASGGAAASGGPRPRGTLWIWLALGLTVLGGGGWAIRARLFPAGAAGAASGRSATGGDAQERPVNVVVTQVGRRDVPLYLDGLGTVVPLETVVVRSQVDGRLDRVLFTEGELVHKGQHIAQIDPRPFQNQLRSAQAAVARDRAVLQHARFTLERDLRLVGDKLVSQQEVDDQRAQVAQLDAALGVNQSAVDAARLQLDFARITSPIEGVTGVRLVDPGNVVRQSDSNGLVVITRLDPIGVLFTLPQDDLPRVAKQLGQGQVRVEAWNRDGSLLLGSGKVALIDNQINASTGTMRLKASFENPERLLWPNQFVKARLLLLTERGALVIPATAVQRGPNGDIAYVVGADRTVSLRTLRVGGLLGEIATVVSGLAEGETIVVEGQSRLRPGMHVIPKPFKARGAREAERSPAAGAGGAGPRESGP